jgi:hypothetical protein
MSSSFLYSATVQNVTRKGQLADALLVSNFHRQLRTTDAQIWLCSDVLKVATSCIENTQNYTAP